MDKNKNPIEFIKTRTQTSIPKFGCKELIMTIQKALAEVLKERPSKDKIK